MKRFSLGTYALSGGVAVALLAGCGGSQPPIGAPGAMPQASARATYTAPRWSALRPGARSLGYKSTAPLLYVTNYDNNDVTVYRAKAKDPVPLATISDGISSPSGACIDGHGTLYVTNEPASGPGWISEYPLGKVMPSKMIKDGVSTPAFCAIDAKENIWVTNIGLDNVTEYLEGSTKPHATITKGLTYPDGTAIDRTGNLYVGNLLGSSSNIQVFPSGSKSPSRTITNGITWPVGITVDSNATLYVTNAEQNNVEEYRSGQNYPFQAITSGADDPDGVTVNQKGLLYVANAGSNTVVEYLLGSLTPLKRRISKDLYTPEGIAYYPALLP